MIKNVSNLGVERFLFIPRPERWSLHFFTLHSIFLNIKGVVKNLQSVLSPSLEKRKMCREAVSPFHVSTPRGDRYWVQLTKRRFRRILFNWDTGDNSFCSSHDCSNCQIVPPSVNLGLRIPALRRARVIVGKWLIFFRNVYVYSNHSQRERERESRITPKFPHYCLFPRP